MMGIILFDEKTKCCACGACKNICPKGAIAMKEDEYGRKTGKRKDGTGRKRRTDFSEKSAGRICTEIIKCAEFRYR